MELYEDLFYECLDEKTWDIYAGPAGVAAFVALPEDQMSWYRMGDEAVPHESLAIHGDHQEKDLGPMVRTAIRATEWQQTQLTDVYYSPSCKTYCISVTATDQSILEHKHLRLTHGREKSDHEEAIKGLAELPESLWSKGPTDVGLKNCSPVTLQLKKITHRSGVHNTNTAKRRKMGLQKPFQTFQRWERWSRLPLRGTLLSSQWRNMEWASIAWHMISGQ